MSETLIGLLHPGEMGAAVAACLTGRGYQVLWVPAGRGPATGARAAAAGLTAAAGPDAAGQAADLARRADIILSICPPHAALPVAREVDAAAFTGSSWTPTRSPPVRARQVAAAVEAAGASYVDGGIIGSPPGPGGGSQQYFSGPAAGLVAALFAGTPVDARVIESRGLTAASAVKMAYAGWTKGTAALILAVRALARVTGRWRRAARGPSRMSMLAARMSPSTVKGSSLAVRPVSPWVVTSS